MRFARSAAGCALAVALVAPTTWASAAAPGPVLRAIAASSHIDVTRYGRGVYVDPGIFLTAADAPFEIRVSRDSYLDPIEAWQVLTGGATQDIPAELIKDWWGLSDLTVISVFRDGERIRLKKLDWCPGWSGSQRVDDSGPVDPTYPTVCGDNPFTRGAVFGIDEGWASPLAPGLSFRLREGEYTLRLTVRQEFRDLFGISDVDGRVEVGMTVTDGGDGCPFCPFASATSSTDDGQVGRVRAAVPDDTSPDPGTVPDLIALPAFGIRIETRHGHDLLTFGANVWNAGPAPLVVEGFRRSGEDVMDAYQYFTQDGEVVGRASVGTFEYDHHRGHEHWHFLQFARYRLLDDGLQSIVRSKKQAFCLAPTDAIDLLAPGALWQPGYLGFSRCGDLSSLWIREELPVGWGDTYYQGLFGQGFDITDLPNGTYNIEVTANPKGLLYEVDPANDTEVREVILGGTPGSRTVEVPAWNGLDPESGGS